MEADELLTTGEAAREVGVSRATVARWVRLGLLPARRLPSGHARVRRADLHRLVTEQGSEDEEG
ncbi:MAG: helix-turn-helix domain-containing protein [Candidatus Dormibacteraeota bacterium]|nr:helix-turn-helix domain-containing protein [Candidatus Dormibacteraeota bacterium]MBO0762576.1 helix-turn-helix domain-containing protein [Candidatus Dormibacteraeota bacterium]